MGVGRSSQDPVRRNDPPSLVSELLLVEVLLVLLVEAELVLLVEAELLLVLREVLLGRRVVRTWL